MLIRCIDFETTGLPTEQDRHAVCEVGWCDVLADVADETTGLIQAIIGPPFAVLTNPGRSIPPEARAVHHIGDADVADAQTPALIFKRINADAVSHFCAHNADYERQFFTGGDRPWICTYKVALRLWPDAPSHSLQVLRYWLGLDLSCEAAMPPHRAGPDAYVGAALLARILENGRITVEEMVRWSSGPALLPEVTFGKHKGSHWEDVPTDYLRWIVDKSDMDRDVKANARHWLKQRGG